MVLIAAIAGILVGFTVYGTLIALTVDALHRHELLSASQVIHYLVTDAVGALTAGTVVGILALALLARFVHGKHAVGYARPAECTGLAAWLASSWRFYGRGGWHSGVRVLGLEIAICGTLGST